MAVTTDVDANFTVIDMRLNELQKRYGGNRVRAFDSQTGEMIEVR